MVKVYITDKKISGLRYLPVLNPFFGHIKNEKRLFADMAQEEFTEPVFDLVKDIKEADFVLLPYEYFLIEDTGRYDYLNEYVELSKKHGKKLLVFDLSDFDQKDINIPNAYVFRIGGFDFRQKENEFIMPTFVEDLSKEHKIEYRTKSGKPTVGFAGRAGFDNLKSRIKFHLRNTFIDFNMIVTDNKNLEAGKNGIYFRKKSVKTLEKCKNIITNFIIRRSYSSHINTVELPPEEIRKQYIDNLVSSDFALCVRGDANASCRFYEAISLGRVPLVVATNSIWPLWEDLDYSKFALIIDFKDLNKVCNIVSDFYKNISNDEFVEMQKNARQVFEGYLSVKGYLKYILPKLAKSS